MLVLFSKKQFDAILFDLDGTIIESLDALFDVYKAFLRSFEIEGTRTEFEQLNGPSLRQIVNTLAKQHQLAGDSDELYQRYINLICQTYQMNVDLRKGARELLSHCHELGFKQGLVTSAPAIVAEQLLTREQLKATFAVVVTGDMVSESKPNPEIYRRALQEIRCAASRVVAVEDSLAGVQSAVSCEIATIGVSGAKPQKLIEAGAQLVVHDLHTLAGYFSS